MALAQPETIRKVFDRVREAAGHGDGELLTRYRTRRDQDAFGSLVRRHGPMVLGVCRRVLRDSHAAEDAFQATFVVLARKADAVRPPDRLAPWLYGVAYRTAMKARGRAFRRQQVEQKYASEVASRPPAASDEAEGLLPLIDEQLNALPEKYRAPLVLCAMQGLNKAEAAERLGLPEGTVSSRLARAREMLRDRLTRRGVFVPAVFVSLFTADWLHAAVPPALTSAATAVSVGSAIIPPTVLALSHEVLRSMSLLKLKVLCALLTGVAFTCGGFGLYALQADDKKPAQPGEKPTVKPDGAKPDGEKPKPAKPDGEKPRPDGEKKPVKPAYRVGGKVASVDAKEHTIMLAIKGDSGLVEKLFPVAPDAKVFIDGKEAKLADVPKNSTASYVAAPAKEGKLPLITELRITGSTVVGVIKEVDVANIALVSEKKPLEFRLTADTKVTVNGKDAKPADLKVGDKVVITLKADESAALAVASGSKPGDGEKPGKPGVKSVKFGGKIASVDASARTVSLAPKGAEGKEIVVKMTADAKITVDGKEVKLDAVPKGAFATFNLASAKDGQLREANELTVAGPTFGGSIKQIDASTITIGNEKADRVLKLLPATKVTIRGKDAKLADLKTGDRVQVALTADETGAILITVGAKKSDGDKPRPENQEDE